MENPNTKLSLRAAALIAGFVSLIMVFCAPFAELYAYPKLVIAGNGADTFKNVIVHQTLLAVTIMAYVITFTGDLIVAGALYILLKPVNFYLSILTALFRLVFATIALVSLLNLVNVFRMVTTPEYLTLFSASQLQAQVMLSLNSFRYGFHFGSLFFGFHLLCLGYLVWRSKYIPSIMGLLLIISGSGYFVSSVQPYLFPGVDINFAVYTFYGELIFILWLLIRGWQIEEI